MIEIGIGLGVTFARAGASFVSGAVTDLRFDRGQYLLNSAIVPASTIDGYHTRSSARWAERADAAWQEFATNAAALMPQRGYDAREGHTVLNASPLNPRAWTVSGATVSDEPGTFLGFSSARRVTSAGAAFHAVQSSVTGGVVSGQVYALRALYAGSKRCRAGVRNGANTSMLTGNVGALSSASTSLGAWSSIENIDHGGGVYEVRAILTASVTSAATFEAGPDSSVSGDDVVTIAGQFVQRPYQTPFGDGTVAADTLVIPAADAGMAVNPASTGLTMFWRGTDFPSAASFPKLLDIRVDGNNRLSFERVTSSGLARALFAGPAGLAASDFGTLAQMPFGAEFSALVTWRPDGSTWSIASGRSPVSASGRTMINSTLTAFGLAVSGAFIDMSNSITRRCGLLPYSLSDGDALALFNRVNEGL